MSQITCNCLPRRSRGRQTCDLRLSYLLAKVRDTMSADHSGRVRRLYKLIFRVHRALPTELQVLGDNYARDEFKRHKNCTPSEANIFLNEWMDYAINLAKQMKSIKPVNRNLVGKQIDPKILDHMRDEQIMQLYELRKAALKIEDESSSAEINEKM